MSRVQRNILVAAIILAVAGLVVTMDRWPTFWPDAQLYASIARTRQLTGGGVPWSMRHSPAATDHVVFYGPVFFELGAKAFDWFGVSKWAFRLVSLGGALLFVGAGALLSRAFGGSSDRMALSAALLVLTPEVFLHARSGSMDMVAVALELIALVAFVRGLLGAGRTRQGLMLHGAASGGLLALSVLTTPRAFPFAVAFFAAGAVALAIGCSRSDVRDEITATCATFVACLGTWAATIPGGPLVWLRYMTFVATHESSDVALLPGGGRTWAFAISNLVTPGFAVLGALAGAAALQRTHRTGNADTRLTAMTFALVAGWITFVGTAVVMNLTMTVGTYFALPLFAIVVSLPAWCFDACLPRLPARPMAAAVGILLCCEIGVTAVRYVRIAAGWNARDPQVVHDFLAAHVPRGSDVVGPTGRYFFAVEGSGSDYFSYEARSWADWASWVPVFNPAAVGAMPRVRPPAARFLIWDGIDSLPAEYACATRHVAGAFEPPHTPALDALGWIAASGDRGYESFTLYRLDADCPRGYDPTASPAPAGKVLR